ncbi:pyrroline-5-carboxylate reductase [Stakelama tenebrarum]|uniref:Pyrroline-5-carboxylate reductase n=1 Tax=Stakelama tenebrarum TaxID=2711215 RepID=A0A6G6Y3W7_9SPHN|nr:pyrroline-5-carboxylate reductase [Sphingosinithalassobacter tenebrarum]QIG79622.1 pyrroline-5-carboxylate reductase [Sphingosinithalassobacter tenebrarum]
MTETAKQNATTEFKSIWLIGCGNMAGAILRSWVEAGIDPSIFTVIDPGEPKLPKGITHVSEPPEGWPDAAMLGVKPQLLDKVAPLYSDVDRGGKLPLLISILAGVEESALARRFDADAIVRLMPNLPVAIGKGVAGLYSSDAEPALRDKVSALMAPLGLVEWIDSEQLFDVVTALAGSGPGFVYRVIDALAAGAADLGLPKDQALRMATATVEGSATLAANADETPGELADKVASPGGSTREGLNVLDADDAVFKLMHATLAAATKRNQELAAAARD